MKSALKRRERGVIITLVAVFMLFVIGAMAALSIDLASLYTARSEAQLAADGAALAAARVMANSGMTSDPTGSITGGAEDLAKAVALEIAKQNIVGGANLKPGEIAVVFGGTPPANPYVTVTITKNTLPTFFARLLLSSATQMKVAASARAEAYNPSTLQGTGSGPGLPVAPQCVKPWLLPNISPRTAGYIFTPSSGAIADTTLLGWSSNPPMALDCAGNGGTCTTAPGSATAWHYYPGTTNPGGATTDFPAPVDASCTGCSFYQLSIEGCVQPPISCNQTVHVDTATGVGLNTPTATAVNALTHSTANGGDQVDPAFSNPPVGIQPFEFIPGSANPTGLGVGDVMVSDSLVTVPIFDPNATTVTFPQVQIIGFVQLFLNPTGQQIANGAAIPTQVINLVGCGGGAGQATGTPIIGNGASAVAVRLISKTGT